MEMKTFEAEAPDGTPFRFVAPANSTPEQLQQIAAAEYRNQKAKAAPEPEAAPPEAPASSPIKSSIAEAKQALGDVASETGLSEPGIAGGAIGALTGLAETKRLGGFGPASILEKAASGAQKGLTMAPQMPATPPAGPLSAELTAGEKWGAKTGYGVGPGTVQEASSRYQRAAGQGPVSGQMAKAWGVAQPGESAQLSQRLIDRAKAAELLRNPPPKSGLDQVTQMFRGMAETGSKTARALGGVARSLPVISYPMAGYSMGQDIGEIQRQLAQQNPDYADIALRGAGTLGTAMSLHPVTAPVGLPMALAAPAIAAARRKIMAQPKMPEATYDETVKASRPFIGYPRP